MDILRKLWAIYSILIFFLLWLVLFPLYYIAFLVFPRAWVRHIIWFSHHVYTRLFFGLTLVRFKVEGLENIDRKQPYIIVSNHQTALDFMMNARAFPGVYKFLAKKELIKVPLFGFIVRKLCVLVDRSSAASRSSSMKYLHRTLEEDGYSVFLYPEGTRNTTPDPLLPFHKGAFRIAIEAQKPIAVQTILNIEKISNPKHKGLDMWPGTVRIVWSKPIETAGLKLADAEALSERVREVILKNLKKQ
jgi:1-acyl-sn-glycerol-3-phosphate acyltransferase